MRQQSNRNFSSYGKSGMSLDEERQNALAIAKKLRESSIQQRQIFSKPITKENIQPLKDEKQIKEYIKESYKKFKEKEKERIKNISNEEIQKSVQKAKEQNEKIGPELSSDLSSDEIISKVVDDLFN